MANKLKGEDTITLDGAEYVVRLSLGDIHDLEVKTSRGYLELVGRWEMRTMTLVETTTILTAGINGGKNKTPEGKLRVMEFVDTRRVMEAAGYMNAYRAVGRILTIGAHGGEPEPGKSETENA